MLALAVQGHERAFEVLVQRYRQPLLRYCDRLGLPESRAEDVLQHAMFQAWLALEGPAAVRELRPWLYRVVHNAALNSLRREQSAELSDTRVAVLAGAGGEFEHRLRAREALTSVAELPQMQRNAILLTAIDGCSHEEAAAALGISHDAVRGLLYRARTTLRSAAAAICPQALIGWAAGAPGGGATAAGRVAELSSGSAAAGLAAVFAKGAAVAVTAGALLGGVASVELHRHRSMRHSGPAAVESSAAVPGAPGAASTVHALAGGALARAPASPTARAAPRVSVPPAAAQLRRHPAPSGSQRSKPGPRGFAFAVVPGADRSDDGRELELSSGAPDGGRGDPGDGSATAQPGAVSPQRPVGGGDDGSGEQTPASAGSTAASAPDRSGGSDQAGGDSGDGGLRPGGTDALDAG